MIKVLKEGSTCERIWCGGCGSLLEYNPTEDIQISYSHRHAYKYIICPVCGGTLFPPAQNKKHFKTRTLWQKIFG